MRHTHATLLHALGADPLTIKNMLDHEHLRTTKDYTLLRSVRRRGQHGINGLSPKGENRQQK